MNPQHNKPIDAGTRLGTMFLDHVFMTTIAMIFFIPVMISGLMEAFKVTHEQSDLNFMKGPALYIGIFGFALYFCKDIINGRSLAKRMLKLQVVDNKSGKVATPMQCLVRNIFCVLWMIEGIVALTNTSRRLGDRVAGTRLVYYDKTLEQPRTNIAKIILPIGISYGLMLLLLIQLTPSIGLAKTNYSETSFNQSESKSLEGLMRDSLGQYLSPDIRVYDSIKDEKLKYISTILILKENYIADEESYDQLHELVTHLIYSKFPKETFTGQIKYIYKGEGQFKGTTTSVGTYLKPKSAK